MPPRGPRQGDRGGVGGRDSARPPPLPSRPGLSTGRARRPAREPGVPIVQSQWQAPGTAAGDTAPTRPLASTEATRRSSRPRRSPRPATAEAGGALSRGRPATPFTERTTPSDLQGRRSGPPAARGRSKQVPAPLRARRQARPTAASPDPPEARAAQAREAGPQAKERTRAGRGEGAEPAAGRRCAGGGARPPGPGTPRAAYLGASSRRGGRAVRARCGEEKRGSWGAAQTQGSSPILGSAVGPPPRTIYLRPGPSPAP